MRVIVWLVLLPLNIAAAIIRPILRLFGGRE
jgi:hypothetical protein